PVPDCWPPTAVMLAVAVSARAFTADPRIEVTLSPRLRTSLLPVTPAGVADRWRNIGQSRLDGMSAIVAGSFYGANPIEKSRDRSGGRLGSDRLRSTSQR